MNIHPLFEVEKTNWIIKKKPRGKQPTFWEGVLLYLAWYTEKDFPETSQVTIELPITYNFLPNRTYNVQVENYILIGLTAKELQKGDSNSSMILIAECTSWFKRN
jgi:hypothetical protein